MIFCLLICVSFGSSIFAQLKDTSAINPKPALFSSSERDSLQLWFYDRATVMGLKDEKRDEFYNIVLYHTFKMKSLEKKEKGYSSIEIRAKFEELLKKQNNEIKTILDEKQYAYYLDTYNKLLKSVYQKKGWN